MGKAALVFHMNFDHANLSRNDFIELVKTDLEAMVDSIKTPINLSSTARDWELLEEMNPRVLDKIRNHQHIKVLNGLYSHALPSQFYEHMQMQFEIGTRVHRRIFGANLSPYGLVPEFAFDSSLLVLANQYWQGHIASSTAAPVTKVHSPSFNGVVHNGEDGEDLDIINVFGPNGQTYVINLAKKEGANVTLHKYFRGLNDPQFFTDRLDKAADSRLVPFIVYVQDFETPIINKTMHEGQKIKRLDKWHELMAHLSTTRLQTIPLNLKALYETRDYAKHRPENYVLLPRDKKKWMERTNCHDLREHILQTAQGVHPTSTYETKAILEAMSSDAFVVLSTAGVKTELVEAQIYDQKQKKKVPTKSVFTECDPMRYLEAEHILWCIENGKPVNEDICRYPAAHQLYFEMLDRIFRRPV